jgi:hypothetical protein
MSEPNAVPQKSGCLKGCAVGCLTVVLLAGVGGFLSYNGLKRFAGKVSAEYTEAAPTALPPVAVSDAEMAALGQRLDAFKQAVDNGAGGQEIALTAQDLNVLIQKSPDTADKLRVRIEGNQLQGTVCVPLDKIGGPFNGRWLNGEATFRVDTAAAGLLVFLDDLKVSGKPLPAFIMGALRDQNLAENAMQDPKAAAILQKLESVAVRDGKLILRSKGTASLGVRGSADDQ